MTDPVRNPPGAEPQSPRPADAFERLADEIGRVLGAALAREPDAPRDEPETALPAPDGPAE
jgi:hypothetical protein